MLLCLFNHGLNIQILTFLKSFLGNIEINDNIVLSDEICDYINKSSDYLKKLNYNISSLNDLVKTLEDLKLSNLSRFKDICTQINKYNEKYENKNKEIFDSLSDIQKFIYSLSLLNISNYISMDENSPSKIILPAEANIANKIQNSSTEYQENTLIISDMQGKVILPYKITDLTKILNENKEKYNSIEDVILGLYTIPIKNYRFLAVSRFREAYSLIVHKEKGSKKEAISLASELFSNFNLHPAIITACKNLNELDIYLSCLEYDELEDFRFFKINYEIAPSPIRKALHPTSKMPYKEM